METSKPKAKKVVKNPVQMSIKSLGFSGCGTLMMSIMLK